MGASQSIQSNTSNRDYHSESHGRKGVSLADVGEHAGNSNPVEVQMGIEKNE